MVLQKGEENLAQRKRKLISDFFPVSPKRKVSYPPGVVESESGVLGNIPSTTNVPGLSLHLEFVTREEEARLLSFLYDESKCTWRSDLARRCMHFGGSYCLFTPLSRLLKPEDGSRNRPSSTQEVIQVPAMPPDFDWLLDTLVSQGVFEEGNRPQYCIVNEYIGSQGISAHVENFSFAEPVVGLSLLCPVPMRFHELVTPNGGSVRSGKAALAAKTGRSEEILLPGRSLCVMRRQSRWKWQHEICRVKRGRKGVDGQDWKRVSLTFRYKSMASS